MPIPTAVPPGRFFGLVDAHITAPMNELGYVRLPENYVDRQAEKETRFSVGYESQSDEVCARVLPADPQSADEAWIDYFPKTGRLRFHIGGPMTRILAFADTDEARHRIVDTRTPIDTRMNFLEGAVRNFAATIKR